jgi:hypothetical protein
MNEIENDLLACGYGKGEACLNDNVEILLKGLDV